MFYKTNAAVMEKKIEKERLNLSESDPAAARDNYLRAKKDLDLKMEQIDAIEHSTNELRKDLKSRTTRWRQFRSHIAELTNIGFDEQLSKKGSAGEIEFDHENKQLNLVVQKVS